MGLLSLSYDSFLLSRKTSICVNCYLPSRGGKKICNERYERVTKDLINTIHKVKNEHKNKRIYTLAFGDLNFCIFKHNGDKKRLRLIKTLIKELDGTYHIPDLPTHKSRAHVGSESHLDGAILEDGLNLEMMQVLDEEDFAAGDSDHKPVLIEISIPTSEAGKKENRVPPPDPWPYNEHKKIQWHLVDKAEYKVRSDYYLNLAKQTCQDLPWEVKFKTINDMMNEAAFESMKAVKKPKDEHLEMLLEEWKKLQEERIKIRAQLKAKGSKKSRSATTKMSSKDRHKMKISLRDRNLLELQDKNLRRRMRVKRRDMESYKRLQRFNRLNQCMAKNDQKALFKVVNTFKPATKNEFPEKIEYNGKLYEDERAMEGLEAAAVDQGRNDDFSKTRVNRSYTYMKMHNMAYRARLGWSGRKIRHFDNEEILKDIRGMANNKAPDVYGITKENMVNLTEEGQAIVFPLISNMLEYPELYCKTLANLSVASYLYKGKLKPKDKVTSYRKISIGSFLQKVVDRIMAPSTKHIAKTATQPTQYGFTPGVNYLLCGVLRETLVRRRQNQGKKTFILAVDVQNALSTTSREAQMYELKQIGESEGIWSYSKATYTNTWTVLKNGKQYSALIKESKGSKQGGIKSATDYKAYNRPLYEMITISNLGIVEKGISYGSIMVADDGLSLLGSLEALRQISKLYTAFSEQYGVTFCYNKTIINVVGTQSDKEELHNSNIKIGGVTPNFDPTSLHIGLMMSENVCETETLNVEHRLKKVREASYGYLKGILWDHRNKPTVDTRLKLYESIIRPVMISGLNALKLSEKQRKEIIDFEKRMLRQLLGLRDRASMSIIYKLTGQLPITAHLDNAILSILHNIWKNDCNPIHELIKDSASDKEGKNTWAREADSVAVAWDNRESVS